MQNSVSIVVDRRHDKTRLENQIGRYSAGAGTFCNDRRELRVTSSLGFRLDRLRYLFALQGGLGGVA